MKPNGSIRVSQSNVGRIKNQSDQKGKDDPLGRTNRALFTSANDYDQRVVAVDVNFRLRADHNSAASFCYVAFRELRLNPELPTAHPTEQ